MAAVTGRGRACSSVDRHLHRRACCSLPFACGGTDDSNTCGDVRDSRARGAQPSARCRPQLQSPASASRSGSPAALFVPRAERRTAKRPIVSQSRRARATTSTAAPHAPSSGVSARQSRGNQWRVCRRRDPAVGMRENTHRRYRTHAQQPNCGQTAQAHPASPRAPGPHTTRPFFSACSCGETHSTSHSMLHMCTRALRSAAAASQQTPAGGATAVPATTAASAALVSTQRLWREWRRDG
jgi:hypothetical protein